MEENSKKKKGLLSLLVHFDIGSVVFFIILVYIVISIALYATSKKTEVYEVRTGSLFENSIYRGIALREETVVGSSYAGTVNYYNKEGDRVKVGGLAYTIIENGELDDYADAGALAADYFTVDDLKDFGSEAASFSSSFDPSRFYSVYDFKSTSSSEAQKICNRKVLSQLSERELASIHRVGARQTGSIVYSYDNYDGKDFDKLTPADFDCSACRKVQLFNGASVKVKSPVYRIVTDENWSVAILPDSREQAELLLEEKYVEVRFLKNGFTSWASVKGRKVDEDTLILNLCFTNSMEAFCMDRFIDLEILSVNKKGLKVPATSITEGDFFLVPKEFVFEGSNGQQGVLLRVYKEGGNIGTRFVPSVPYSETKNEYYIDDSVLKAGMTLERPNSMDQCILEKKETLIGVYYINKGYPDFRQVTIRDQNSEYCIVESNELYGLQEYDYIVLYADSIRFNNY